MMIALICIPHQGLEWRQDRGQWLCLAPEAESPSEFPSQGLHLLGQRNPWLADQRLDLEGKSGFWPVCDRQ